MEDLTGFFAVFAALIGLPWLIFHYITKWRQAPKITDEDERLLDEMYMLARRLEDRLNTVERIVAADHPDWKPGLAVTQDSYPIDRQIDRSFDRQLDRRN